MIVAGDIFRSDGGKAYALILMVEDGRALVKYLKKNKEPYRFKPKWTDIATVELLCQKGLWVK